MSWNIEFIDKYNIYNWGVIHADTKAEAIQKCFEVFDCTLIKKVEAR